MNWTEDDLREWRERQNPKGDAAPTPTTDARCEADIQAECVKLMQEDGWRAIRTDPVSDKSRGKGFGELGMADTLFMRPLWVRGSREHNPTLCDCEVIWIEWKARGGKVAAHQTDWHAKERARGFLTWIASVDFPASVEGFREHYAASGLMRRSKWW